MIVNKLVTTLYIFIYIQLVPVPPIHLFSSIADVSLFLLGTFSQVIAGEISTYRAYAVSGGRMVGWLKQPRVKTVNSLCLSFLLISH